MQQFLTKAMYLLIGCILFLSVFSLPIAIVYLLFADTKSTLEILLFALVEYCILFVIFVGAHKLLQDQHTKRIAQVLLSALFIAVAFQFVKSSPAGCVTAKYIDCD